jgi:hypothetical protein
VEYGKTEESMDVLKRLKPLSYKYIEYKNKNKNIEVQT